MAPLRLLLVDGSREDADRTEARIRGSGRELECVRITTPQQLSAALTDGGPWDGILAEYDTPDLGPAEIIAQLADHGLDLPFILVSAQPEEDVAEAALRDGAHDFIPKTCLARLGPALDREIRDAGIRRRGQDSISRAEKMEAIGSLAGGIAHDFNNMLTVMGGAAEMLLDGMAPHDPARGDAEEIRQTVHKAQALTRQLLAFSRTQVQEIRAIDINQMVAAMEPLLRRLIGAEIVLEVRPDARRPLVRGDDSQIQQVLLNLVVNARDAMPDGGSVVIETVAGQDDFVEIRVRDTGIGIDPAVVHEIFEPFFTTKEEGTGLGLATVYGVVSQSGGEVTCASTPGAGTTFCVRLPASHDEQQADPVPPARPLLGAGQRILLAEDDPGVRRFAHRALTIAGYAVIDAIDGGEAKRILNRLDGDVDLVLTDVVMPGTSGMEMVAWAKARWPSLPALFMSGYPHADLVARGLAVDEDELLVKPFEAAALLERVHLAIASRDVAA
jgi:two-component system, cell cycle sensor histidine kinase and response regulator CckA